MNSQSRTLFTVLILIMGGLFLLQAQAVQAGPNGTTSLRDIINANSPDDSDTPNEAGEMSVEWANRNAQDTQYADSPGTVETSVDTGYDQIPISDPAGAPGTLTAGDSQVYTLRVQNKGNNAKAVEFTLQLSEESGTTASFSTEWFQEDSGNNSFDTNTDARVNSVGSDSPVFFAENEAETYYAVITAHSDASDGDTLENRFFSTDNAPIGNGSAGTPGDQWENTTVIAGGAEDANDTQNVFFTTSIEGPVLEVSKSFDLVSGEARPGDTVAYTLTLTNTGSDTANNVSVYDAMPDSTTLVDTGTIGSSGDEAAIVAGGSQFTVSTEHDNSLTGSFSTGASVTNTERLKMILDNTNTADGGDLGPSGGIQNTVDIRFWVTID